MSAAAAQASWWCCCPEQAAAAACEGAAVPSWEFTEASPLSAHAACNVTWVLHHVPCRMAILVFRFPAGWMAQIKESLHAACLVLTRCCATGQIPGAGRCSQVREELGGQRRLASQATHVRAGLHRVTAWSRFSWQLCWLPKERWCLPAQNAEQVECCGLPYPTGLSQTASHAHARTPAAAPMAATQHQGPPSHAQSSRDHAREWTAFEGCGALARGMCWSDLAFQACCRLAGCWVHRCC